MSECLIALTPEQQAQIRAATGADRFVDAVFARLKVAFPRLRGAASASEAALLTLLDELIVRESCAAALQAELDRRGEAALSGGAVCPRCHCRYAVLVRPGVVSCAHCSEVDAAGQQLRALFDTPAVTERRRLEAAAHPEPPPVIWPQAQADGDVDGWPYARAERIHTRRAPMRRGDSFDDPLEGVTAGGA